MKMKKLLATLLASTMVFTTGVTTVAASEVAAVKEGKKVITYLPCWESKSWEVEDIQGDKLTHVLLSFARIDNGFKISDKEVRIHTEGGEYAMPDLISAEMIMEETWDKVAQLQEKYPHLKFIVAVGGWEAEGFSDMAASAATREIFVDSVVEYVKEHKLDGIDLDWEYPVGPPWGGHPIETRTADKDNFTELVKLLRQKLGEEQEISFCANVSGWFLDAIDFDAVTPLVDSVNIMSYDMHGSWDDKAFHHSPLYPNPNDPVVTWGLSDAETVQRFIARGVPAEKLVLGYPAYGKEFHGITAGEKGDGLFQPFAADAEGKLIDEKALWRGGSIPYSVLKEYYIGKNGFVRYWDDASKVPYLYDGKTFITYEDAESLALQAAYVKEQGLAGMMYWEYVNDIDGELLTVVHDSLK